MSWNDLAYRGLTVRPFDGWPDYGATEDGRIYRITGGKGVRAGREVRPQANNRGYLTVQLYLAGKATRHTVHSLVASVFIGPRPVGAEVNHRDGNKTNNAASNLEYVTSSANKRHAVAAGIAATGERNGAAKLSDAQVADVRLACALGEPQRSVARHFGISQGHVSDLVRGKRRKVARAKELLAT